MGLKPDLRNQRVPYLRDPAKIAEVPEAQSGPFNHVGFLRIAKRIPRMIDAVVRRPEVIFDQGNRHPEAPNVNPSRWQDLERAELQFPDVVPQPLRPLKQGLVGHDAAIPQRPGRLLEALEQRGNRQIWHGK